VEGESYEAHLYADFSSLPPLPPLHVQIFSSESFIETTSIYFLPLLWEIKFHTRTVPRFYVTFRNMFRSFFYGEALLAPAQPRSRRTNPCRLSVADIQYVRPTPTTGDRLLLSRYLLRDIILYYMQTCLISEDVVYKCDAVNTV
jgi:hypothetical protein